MAFFLHLLLQAARASLTPLDPATAYAAYKAGWEALMLRVRMAQPGKPLQLKLQVCVWMTACRGCVRAERQATVDDSVQMIGEGKKTVHCVDDSVQMIGWAERRSTDACTLKCIHRHTHTHTHIHTHTHTHTHVHTHTYTHARSGCGMAFTRGVHLHKRSSRGGAVVWDSGELCT